MILLWDVQLFVKKTFLLLLGKVRQLAEYTLDFLFRESDMDNIALRVREVLDIPEPRQNVFC